MHGETFLIDDEDKEEEERIQGGERCGVNMEGRKYRDVCVQ